MINDLPLVISARIPPAVLGQVLGLEGRLVDLAIVDLVPEESSGVVGRILGDLRLVVVELDRHSQLRDLVSGHH